MYRLFIVLALVTVCVVATAGEGQTIIPSEQDLAVCSAQAQISNSGSATFLSGILDTSDWPARWNCGIWTPFHGWLYILSDIVIWLSYFAIPLTLGFFVYKRKQEPVPFKSIIILFILFILACGLTHLIDAVIFWWPAYRLSALLRLATAGVSMGTVFALVKIAPQVIELKSPQVLERMVQERTAKLEELTAKLIAEVSQREYAEKKLKELYADLAEKNKVLEEANINLINRERDLIVSEERVKELNASLEKKVDERTAQLYNINNELEAFTYSVSHDLRAPLRAIDGYAQILADDYDSRIDANGKRLLAVIARNAKYMGQLIDDLLEFSRTSRSEITRFWFDTDKEVRQIVADMLSQIPNRRIEVDIQSLEGCRGDISMLKQVWVNLISNALKYTQREEIAHVEIGSIQEESSIHYYIRDNGVGFDMDYIDKLFGVFQRLHRKEEFEGTGVGLALVKRIITRHGGQIWAESELNEGATFHFTLPL